jgi:hypothetical protein
VLDLSTGLRPIGVLAVRTAVMIGVALMLILVLLPAVLGAAGSGAG